MGPLTIKKFNVEQRVDKKMAPDQYLAQLEGQTRKSLMSNEEMNKSSRLKTTELTPWHDKRHMKNPLIVNLKKKKSR